MKNKEQTISYILLSLLFVAIVQLCAYTETSYHLTDSGVYISTPTFTWCSSTCAVVRNFSDGTPSQSVPTVTVSNSASYVGTATTSTSTSTSTSTTTTL